MLFSNQYGNPTKTARTKLTNLYSDVSSMLLPNDHKELLRWCQMFYKIDDKVSNVIYKLSEYAATRVQIDTKDKAVQEKYEAILKQLQIDDKIISMGITYFTYADVIISAIVPVKRIFTCKKCGTTLDPKGDLQDPSISKDLIINNDGSINTSFKKNKPNWRIRKHQLEIYCPKCKQFEPVDIEDVVDTSRPPTIKLYDLLQIDIEYNPLNEDRQFIYTIPDETIKKIKTKSYYIKTTPLESLQAVLKGYKKIKFYNDKIIHISRPTLVDDKDPWSIPPILHVFKLLTYLQALRRGTEFTALDNLNRYRYLTVPPDSGDLGVMSYKKLKNAVTKAQQVWQKDPSYIPLFPAPVVYQGIGGEGRSLLLTPEMANVSDAIISGLQVPKEFVYGGLTWSGSSVSMRMLENHFINYRNKIQQFLDYISKLISKLYDLPLVKLRLSEFKMADDMQRKQLLLNLNANGKISDQTILQEFNLDEEKEFERSKQETYKQQVALTVIQSKLQLLQTLLAAKIGDKVQEPDLDLSGVTLDADMLKEILSASSIEELANAPAFQEFLNYIQTASSQERDQIIAQLQARDSIYTKLLDLLQQGPNASIGTQAMLAQQGGMPPQEQEGQGAAVTASAPEGRAPAPGKYGI